MEDDPKKLSVSDVLKTSLVYTPPEDDGPLFYETKEPLPFRIRTQTIVIIPEEVKDKWENDGF